MVLFHKKCEKNNGIFPYEALLSGWSGVRIRLGTLVKGAEVRKFRLLHFHFRSRKGVSAYSG